MIIIDDTLISDEVYTEYFVCDLPKCLGGCCVHGDAGAPLDKDEAKILDKIYPDVKPYLRSEGIQEIEAFGKSVMDIDGEYTTPLIKGKSVLMYSLMRIISPNVASRKPGKKKKLISKNPFHAIFTPSESPNTPTTKL
jgi:hypothetical protein